LAGYWVKNTNTKWIEETKESTKQNTMYQKITKTILARNKPPQNLHQELYNFGYMVLEKVDNTIQYEKGLNDPTVIFNSLDQIVHIVATDSVELGTQEVEKIEITLQNQVKAIADRFRLTPIQTCSNNYI
jgi:hydroxymethylpyrimidine pyrophosphatase-like HAD family hydrolase